MLSSTLLAAAALAIQAPLIAPLPRVPLPKPAANVARAVPNGNHAPAGTRKDNVLTLAIDVVESGWHPEGESDPEVPILAFAERGKMPQVPGPLVRVPQGTEIRLVLRSRVDTALWIGGLRPGVSEATDTVHLAARGTRELRYRLDTPGTYFYWGAFAGTSWADRLWRDSQLNGAIVVEPPGGSSMSDRVLVISEWFYPYDDERRPFEVVSVINGKGWPHTERLTMQQGDSMRFRVINTIPLNHPMHLHGFYYRVEARGTWNKDGPITREMQPLLNTDLMKPGATLTLSFAATTPGNWLFHCHFSPHMDETVTLAGSPRDSAEATALASRAHRDHATGGGAGGREGNAEHHMRGLVMGIRVTPKPGYVAYQATDAREIRLLAQKKAGRLIGGSPAYGFVVQKGDSVPARDSVQLPAPVLELERGKPVRVTVVNNLDEPTGIHWHGLEIESFPDGVPNWSGMGDHIFPPVAPGKSFVAEFTPPRAGTFPYHSHLNERHQINSGMYGAIIVTDKPRDLARDHLIIAGGGGPSVFAKLESPYALVNGSRFPAPLRLTAGEVHRLRIVSIHPEWRVMFTLRTDTTIARWRAVAKDGADLPAVQATERVATVEMGPGETADFEFAPSTPGEWRMEIRTVDTGWYIPLAVIVTERKKEQPRD